MSNQGIVITVTAETAAAAQKMQQFFSGLNANLEKLGGLGGYLEELGAKLTALFTVGAMVDFTKEAINAAEAMGQLSRNTGISIQFLSALREEADKTAVGFQGASAGLEFFARNLGAAVQQGGPILQALRDLIGGDNVRQFAQGLQSTDQVLREVVTSLNKMPDGPSRANVAAQVFGRQWRDILPVVTQVQGELDKGLITEQMVKDSTEFNRSLREMRETFELIFIEIAQKILPKLQEMGNWFKAMASDGGTLQDSITAFAAILAMKLTQALEKGFVDASVVLGEQFIHLAGMLSKAIDDALTGAISKFISIPGLSNIPGLQILTLPQFTTKSDIAGQMKEQIDQMHKGAEILKGGIDEFFTKGISAARAVTEEAAKVKEQFRQAAEFAIKAPGLVASMFGFGASSSSGGAGAAVPMSDAAKKILDEVNQKWAESTQSKLKLLDLEEQKLKEKVDEEVLDVAKAEEAKRKITETYAALRREIIQKQADEQKALQLSAIEGQRKLIEGDPFLTDLQKRERLLDLLKEENRLLEQNIEIKKRQVTDPNASDESKLLAEKQLQDLQMRRADTQQSITNTSAEGTMSGEFRRVLTDMGNQWGSWAHQIANTFQNVIGGAIDVISKGITGLILGTKTWGQALSEIGTSVLNMIINAIVKMFVTWIVNMTVLRLLQKLFGTESNTQAAQSAAAWTPAAVAASIASYGAAATVGTASVVAGMAIAEAFAAGMSGAGGAFAEGGRPTVGAVSLVGERGPELFVPDTPGTILPNDVYRSIFSGVSVGAGGSSKTGAGGGGGGGTNIHLGLLSDRSQIPAWARSAQGEAHVVDLVRRNIHLISKG